MTNANWTPAEDAQLKKAAQSSTDFRTMKKLFNNSKSVAEIKQRVLDLGIETPKVKKMVNTLENKKKTPAHTHEPNDIPEGTATVSERLAAISKRRSVVEPNPITPARSAAVKAKRVTSRLSKSVQSWESEEEVVKTPPKPRANRPKKSTVEISIQTTPRLTRTRAVALLKTPSPKKTPVLGKRGREEIVQESPIKVTPRATKKRKNVDSSPEKKAAPRRSTRTMKESPKNVSSVKQKFPEPKTWAEFEEEEEAKRDSEKDNASTGFLTAIYNRLVRVLGIAP